VQNKTATEVPFDRLAAKVASGPPRYSPFRLLDPVANVAEMFIHHEDVRRAGPGWGPRLLDDGTAKALKRTLPLMAWLTLAKAHVKVVLRTSQGETVLTAGKGAAVAVTGTPEELLLFATGRA